MRKLGLRARKAHFLDRRRLDFSGSNHDGGLAGENAGSNVTSELVSIASINLPRTFIGDDFAAWIKPWQARYAP
jgi:hypothetical protein